MKLLIIGPDFFNYTSSLEKAFKSMNCQTTSNAYRNFNDICSYWKKKINNLGIAPLEENYYSDWNQKVLCQVEAFSPDVILVLNGPYLSAATLAKIKGLAIKLVLWLVDSILRQPEVEELIGFYDLLYSFDPQDEIYIYQKYKRVCHYRPGGYDPEIYTPKPEQDRDVDICFVGNPTANRIEALKKVALYAQETKRNFIVYGNYWSTRGVSKKRRFAQKHWPLGFYIQNKSINPFEVAALYRRSKICLNIHIDEHEGVNTRTFEIMGTQSMELVDIKPKLKELVEIGKDLAVYENLNDLIAKIDYYLNHDELRNSIASSGHNKVRGYTILNVAQDIFEGIKGEHHGDKC